MGCARGWDITPLRGWEKTKNVTTKIYPLINPALKAPEYLSTADG